MSIFAKCSERWQGAGFSFVQDEGTARLMDILLFGPLLIATGAAVPNLPKPLKYSLIGAGTFVILWNGIGYLVSLNTSMREEARQRFALPQKKEPIPEGPLPEPDWDRLEVISGGEP